MKYSIIVPVYRVEPYVDECINSVLRQTYGDFELILVDDGSPDNCPLICDMYAAKDERIKVVHKKNGGLVSARKAGLEIASGQYVICLDGDDKIDDKCIEILNKYINEYNPELICFGYKVYRQDKVLKEVCFSGDKLGFYNRNRIEKEILPNLIYDEANEKLPQNVWGKVYKTDLYRSSQMNVDSRITMGEDAACVFPLITKTCTMMVIPECLYYYRKNPSSMTRTKSIYSWERFELIYDLLEKEIELDNNNLFMQFCQARVHNLFIIAASRFYQVKKYSEIIKDINIELNKSKNAKCIEKARFKTLPMKMVQRSLKNRLYCLIAIYSKFRAISKY